MTEPQQDAGQPMGSELSLEELESEITAAEALVETLNRRLKQTAEDPR